jgi:radical SAM superfamily enzyme YgiQ (UPF0313 family)
LDNELLETCSGLDAFTIGEAEETIVEITNLFYGEGAPSHEKLEKMLSNVQGLRTISNIVKPRSAPILDNLPAPDWELLENYWKAPKIAMSYRYSITKRRNPVVRTSREIFVGDSDWGAFDEDINYFGEFESRNERFPFGVIVGSRGCPYKCNFCGSSGNRRLLAAKNIFEQINYLNKKFGIRQFYFFDPLFTTFAEAEQKRVADLSKMIFDSGLSIRYAIEIRADVVLEIPEELLSLMISSGGVEFNLGLEKGSNSLLERTAKGMTIETHRSAVQKLRKVASKVGKEVLINGTFILGGPGENQADIRDTLVHCISLNLDEVGLFPMEIHPGTQCYKRALEKELIEPGLAPYLNVEYYPLYATEVLSASYLWNIKKLGTAFFNELDELKGKMQELEIQFLPESKRNELSKYRVIRTKKLQEIANVSIGKILEYQSGCAEMEKEIESKEKELLRRYRDYDPNYGDYHVGDIQEVWDNCLTKLEQVFQGSRKRTRFHGGEPKAY